MVCEKIKSITTAFTGFQEPTTVYITSVLVQPSGMITPGRGKIGGFHILLFYLWIIGRSQIVERPAGACWMVQTDGIRTILMAYIYVEQRSVILTAPHL